jgi:hypothetical protein
MNLETHIQNLASLNINHNEIKDEKYTSNIRTLFLLLRILILRSLLDFGAESQRTVKYSYSKKRFNDSIKRPKN